MEYNLQLQFTIGEIGATSGLVLVDNFLYIISDNSSYLYEYQIDKNILSKIKLSKNSQENIAKKQKPDFESITLKDKKLHIFGSGSTKNRNLKYSYNLETNQVKEKDFSDKYQLLAHKINIKPTELNIEGAFYNNNKWHFFQRGNGEMAQNGIFIIDKNEKVDFVKIILPKVENIEASFTDAILVNDKIYFLAAVENSNSTYNDGAILGTFIGCMNLNFEMIYIEKISDSQKFEGLTLYNQTNTEIEFLICEDNDKEELISNIYKLTLKNE